MNNPSDSAASAATQITIKAIESGLISSVTHDASETESSQFARIVSTFYCEVYSNIKSKLREG